MSPDTSEVPGPTREQRFIGNVILTTMLIIGIGGSYIGYTQDRKQRNIRETFYNQATKIADTNHDGNLSIEEKLRMYSKIGILINIPGETRKPTTEELERYIKNHEGNRK